MKILLTSNKTYRGMPDSSYWYLYLPLQELEHEVYWYDTVKPEEEDYNKIIEQFKPDLIFCCMTGDKGIAPCEPWEIIKRETDSGRTRTFNWFCDDTWRFESFSKKSCHVFNVCSTPEPFAIQKYRDIGYNNIILGSWHANSRFFPIAEFEDKKIDMSFIGAPNPLREYFFEAVKVPIEHIFGVQQEELFEIYSKTKIGLNLSFNMNDHSMLTQMKQRMFEIPAGAGLLLTEYHGGIEEFFEIDKEIVVFHTVEEFNKKAQFLLKHPQIVEKIAHNGHKRFIAEHDSKIRLENVLQQIEKI